MAEYIERDDALRELEKINPVDYGAMCNYDAHHHVGECLRDCKEALEEIPAADVVPVVRCKDCKYTVETWSSLTHFCIFNHMPIRPDDFCSCGERKDGGVDNV